MFKHYEDVESRIRYLRCNHGDVFVDVGAGIGSWSIHAAIYGANVHAFEIGEPHSKTLLVNAELNKVSDKIHLHNIALSSEDNTELCYDGWMKTYGSKSLGYKQLVKSITLDTWVNQHRDDLTNRVDCIKIDVEGMELDVLRGAYYTIREFEPRLIIEIHELIVSNIRYDVENLLKYLGYEHEHVHGLNDYFYKK